MPARTPRGNCVRLAMAKQKEGRMDSKIAIKDIERWRAIVDRLPVEVFIEMPDGTLRDIESVCMQQNKERNLIAIKIKRNR